MWFASKNNLEHHFALASNSLAIPSFIRLFNDRIKITKKWRAVNSLTLHQPDFFVCTPLNITNLDMDRDFTRTKLLRRGERPSECIPKTFHCRICVQFRILKKLRLSKKTKNKQTNKQKKKRKPVSKLGDKGQDPTDPTNHWIPHFDPVTHYFHMQ